MTQNPHTEEVIIVHTPRGKGISGEDAYRLVLQVFSKDGKFIAERDPLVIPEEEAVECCNL